jgi:hypothetical protein
VVYETASEVLGCKEHVTRRFELSEDHRDDRFDAAASSEDRSKSHQVLLEGVALGEAPFQVRAAVLGELPGHGPEGVIDIATWRDSGESRYAAVRELGRVAFAQAEYYYDTGGSKAHAPSALMWNMKWRARMRRYRAAEEPPDDSTDDAATDIFGIAPPATDWMAACHLAAHATGTDTAICDHLDALWLADLSQH